MNIYKKIGVSLLSSIFLFAVVYGIAERQKNDAEPVAALPQTASVDTVDASGQNSLLIDAADDDRSTTLKQVVLIQEKEEKSAKKKKSAQNETEVENGESKKIDESSKQSDASENTQDETIAALPEQEESVNSFSAASQEKEQQKSTIITEESTKKKEKEKEKKKTEKESSAKKSKSSNVTSQGSDVQTQQQISVSFTIANGSSYTASVPSGSTVEDAMNALKEQGFEYSVISYSGIGSYVSQIEGVQEDGRAGMYWIYYINGVKAQSGISTTSIANGDHIVWRLEKEQ